MSTGDPLGPVVITSRDIYEALIRLTETVNRLVDAGAGQGEDIRDHEQRLRLIEAAQPVKRLDDHAARLKLLESGRWPLPALAVVVSIAALTIPLVAH